MLQEQHALDKFRLRLSQCIILPPFQKQGHGARMLRAFYAHGREDESVLDMSVEDPSPEFQAMRDMTGDSSCAPDVDGIASVAAQQGISLRA